MKIEERISISSLKHRFAQKYPASPIIPILLSLPDKIDADELIGQSIILLEILDMERNNNFGREKQKRCEQEWELPQKVKESKWR